MPKRGPMAKPGKYTGTLEKLLYQSPPGRMYKLMRLLLLAQDIWRDPLAEIPPHYDMSGWIFICDVGYPPGEVPSYINWAGFAPGIACNAGAVDVPAGLFGDSPVWGPGNVRWFSVGQNNDIGTVGRMGRNQQWHRTIGDLTVAPPFVPLQPGITIINPPPEVPFSPFLIPEQLPPGITVQHPPAIPYTLLPRRPLNKWPQGPSAGYGPKVGPKVGPSPPYIIIPDASGDTGPNEPGPHIRKPPEKGTKERKKALDAAGFAASLYGSLTEVGDWVDAINKALPVHLRSHGGLTDKIENLYENFEAIDLETAIKELILNEIQDRVVGKIGGLTKKGTRKAAEAGYYAGGRGLGAGGRFRPQIRL